MPTLQAKMEVIKMADDQQADSAEDKQQEPVPSSKEQSTESNQSQEVAQETGEASEAPAGDSKELELPEGVKERTTEQFDKLKEQLRQTREELLSVKDTVTQPKQVEEKPLYDPKTGLVDIQALEQLRSDARDAKKELENLKRQGVDQEVRALHDAHPEMNPKDKANFDQKLFDEAEKLWLHSQANPSKYGGQPLSQKQAADLAKKSMPAPKPKESSTAEEKTQASAEASGKPTQGVARAVSDEDMQQLAYGTRTGDKDAITARMRLIREASKA